jgi:hypothetical protein
VGVGNYGAIGADFDGGGLLVDVDGDAVAFDVGFDCEVGEDLDGENPGFEGAVLLADDDAVLAGDGEGLERLCVGADHGAGVVECDGGYRRKAGRGHLRGIRLGWAHNGDRESQGKEQGGGPARRASEAKSEPWHCDVL